MHLDTFIPAALLSLPATSVSVVLLLAAGGCDDGREPTPTNRETLSDDAERVGATAKPDTRSIPKPPAPSYEWPHDKPWFGDLDGMTERRLIRALVVYNDLFYFLEGPRQRGMTYDYLKQLERYLNSLLPIALEPAPESFEDADLLKMVDAGILPYAVTESRKAAIWSQLLRHIEVREDLTIHHGGQIAWAFRKKSPELKALLDAFAAKHKQGTLHGNILVNRYLIHAGTKYQRFIYDRYFSQQSLNATNKVLFTMAANNAGPARIAALREQAAGEGLDPDIWINNVETIAAERIGPLLGQYLRNIYSYYLAYRLVMLKQSVSQSVQAAP